MSFVRFFIWSSGGPPVWRSRIFYAILKEGIMGNIHVKLYEIWTSGQKMSFKEKVYGQTHDRQTDRVDPLLDLLSLQRCR